MMANVQGMQVEINSAMAERVQELEQGMIEEITAKAVAETNLSSYREWWAQEHAKSEALQNELADVLEVVIERSDMLAMRDDAARYTCRLRVLRPDSLVLVQTDEVQL
jgi:hypothetical protein